jgi:hypothetical protein
MVVGSEQGLYFGLMQTSAVLACLHFPFVRILQTLIGRSWVLPFWARVGQMVFLSLVLPAFLLIIIIYLLILSYLLSCFLP